MYIFSRINGPIEKHTHFRDGMCLQSGSWQYCLLAAPCVSCRNIFNSVFVWSRERRFCTIYTGCSRLMYIFSRINGPIEKHSHFRDGMCLQSGSWQYCLLSAPCVSCRNIFNSVFVWSRERRFCTIYTGCSRLMYIFSRINGPLEKHSHFRDGMCLQSGSWQYCLLAAPCVSCRNIFNSVFVRSRERRFCTIYTGCSRLMYIFSRINGPIEKHTHFRDGMCLQSGSWQYCLLAAPCVSCRPIRELKHARF